MCTLCDEGRLSRRGFLSLAAAGVVSGLAASAALAAPAAVTTVTADEALARLRAGNERYVEAPALCAAELLQRREQVATSQAPWATIVSCADSRVPPELLFGGLGVGELFVARNAGNIVDTATMGTLEYGAGVLGVPLIVVLGHERCGAVAAACEAVEKGTRFPGAIGALVEAIVPAVRAAAGRPGDFVDNAVRESALRTAARIARESGIVAERVGAGRLKVVAARYDLDAGRVEFLS